MKKKLSTIVLMVSVIGMIIMGISLVSINKNKVELEDIEGNRSEMGDMNVLLQSRKESYEADEIFINKDKETVKGRTKQGAYIANLTKENIKHRDLLEHVNYKNNIFENENEIGFVHASDVYSEDETCKVLATVTLKNKKNNEITKYEIPLEEESRTGLSDSYVTVPIKVDKDIIYVAILSSQFYDDGSYDPTTLNFYKLNLSNKSSKKIISKEYEKDELKIAKEFNSFGFAKDNKIYLLVNKRNKKQSKPNSALLELDVISKDIKFIDLGDVGPDIKEYYMEGNKILLLSSEDLSEITSAVLVNLKDRKIEYNHSLDLGVNNGTRDILQVRRDNKKIYIVTKEFIDNEETSNIYNDYYIRVLDEKSNKELYKGKLKISIMCPTIAGIVKEDEL